MSLPLLEELELSGRVLNCIRGTGCTTLSEVIERTPREWCSVYNFGRLSLKELRDELARHGLSLRNDDGARAFYPEMVGGTERVIFVGPGARPPRRAEWSGDESCEFCRYWRRIELPAGMVPTSPACGGCHRYPPRVVAGWPTVKADDWCGEFKPCPRG